MEVLQGGGQISSRSIVKKDGMGSDAQSALAPEDREGTGNGEWADSSAPSPADGVDLKRKVNPREGRRMSDGH